MVEEILLVKFWKLVLQAIQKKKATQTFFLLLAKDFIGFGRRLPSKRGREREREGKKKERKIQTRSWVI